MGCTGLSVVECCEPVMDWARSCLGDGSVMAIITMVDTAYHPGKCDTQHPAGVVQRMIFFGGMPRCKEGLYVSDAYLRDTGPPCSTANALSGYHTVCSTVCSC